MKRILLALALAPVCFGALGTPIVTNNLTAPADWSYWFANGSMTETAAGLSSSTNGSLIYGVTLPSSYEIRLKYKFVNNGGSYVSYFRATSNANLQANTGAFYALEFSNVTITGSNCAALMTVWRRDGTTLSTVIQGWTACAQDMEFAVTVRDNTLVLYRPDTQLLYTLVGLPSTYPNPAAPGYQGGAGVAGTPSGNGIARADIYAIETTGPVPANIPMTSTSGSRIEMQWQGTIDNGAGLMLYQVWRRPVADPNGWVYRGDTREPAFVDRDAIVNGATYAYMIRSHDFHLNFSDSLQFSVTVPPAGAPDPRQIGIRPTGVYWGGGGEQVDMQSGNLNYTLPVVQAKSRGGLTASFALNYNSQMWRKDLANNATWYYGRDNGYGHGWRLMAGSILPVHKAFFEVAFYVFTDSTGAEYRLDVNNGNVWTTKEGVFVSYDANAQRLYFNDGSFWYMGAESGGTEFDAGVRYPTLIQDSNGNQIGISYQTGANTPFPNSSSRITSIADVTGSYTFVYTGNRLTSVWGGAATTWAFTYGTTTANSPWEPNQNPQNYVQALLSANYGGATHSFNYYATGEMSQVTLPYGGTMRWTYGEWTSASQRIVREVNQRFLAKAPGAPETGHYLYNDPGDASREYHLLRSVHDDSSAYDKVWYFDSQRRLQTFEERKLSPSYKLPVSKAYTWATTPTSEQPYISQVDTTLEPGTANARIKRSIQNLDAYGNMILSKEFDYAASAAQLNETTARWFFTEYLSTAAYVDRYIRNRPTRLRMVVNNVEMTGRSHPLQLRPETWFTFAEHRSKPRELVISGRCEAPAISAREAALRLRPRRALSSALAG